MIEKMFKRDVLLRDVFNEALLTYETMKTEGVKNRVNFMNRLSCLATIYRNTLELVILEEPLLARHEVTNFFDKLYLNKVEDKEFFNFFRP